MNGRVVLDSNTIMDLFNGRIPLGAFKKLPDSIIAATSIQITGNK
jgi:hypothetical protein